MHYHNWCYLESKLSGRFIFIGIFALKMCNNSQNPILKMTERVTSQTRLKDAEKRKNTNGSRVIYVALDLKIQCHDFIMKTFNSKF